MPAVNPSKSTLQNLLTALLSTANQDQNFFYPPYIYQAHFNIVSSFLLNECVRLYTTNSQIVDLIDPFVKVTPCQPTNGVIPLPKDYRNILGSPSINVRADLSGECGENIPITTPQQFLTATLKGGCTRRPVTIVSQSEFDYLTTSTYKKPTYNNPVGFFSGQRSIKVCPYDLSMVLVMYVIKEPTYVYGYIQQPDDTYIFDQSTSTESDWNSDAFQPLLTGLTALYAAYSRDKTFTDFAKILSESNIL